MLPGSLRRGLTEQCSPRHPCSGMWVRVSTAESSASGRGEVLCQGRRLMEAGDGGGWCPCLERPGWDVPGCSAFANHVPQPRAVQVLGVLQVCFLGGLLVFLMPEEGCVFLLQFCPSDSPSCCCGALVCHKGCSCEQTMYLFAP